MKITQNDIRTKKSDIFWKLIPSLLPKKQSTAMLISLKNRNKNPSWPNKNNKHNKKTTNQPTNQKNLAKNPT